MSYRFLDMDQYSARWAPMHAKVFADYPTEIEEGPFRDPSWRMVLLPGELRLDREDFESLEMAAREVGDEQFVVVDSAGAFPDQPAVVFAWDFELFFAYCPSIFAHVVAHHFGLSGEWGRVSSYDGFNILGGSARFLDCFVHSSGGLAVLQERFAEAIRNGEIGWRDQGLAYARTLLRLVGWDHVENDLNA